MFEVIKSQHGRIGKFSFNGKKVNTPCWYMTNDFGGGGGDIYRIITYTDLLETLQTPVLYNLYYLLDQGTVTTKKWTKHISKFENINDFILFIRDKFFAEGYVIKNYKKNKLKWNPITLLDSGSGNYLRDAIKKTQNLDEVLSIISSQILQFYEFCENRGIDIMMAMDLAGKYTHRQKESEQLHYLNISKKLSNSSKINIELLAKTLDVLKNKKLKSLIYAPIHGQTPKEYGDFVNSLLDLEEQKKIVFDGFGLGGIANYREKNNEDWEIHEEVNSRVKSGIIISKATQAVRKILDKRKDYRPIHALGVGSAENIIPLVNAGADTFDAHSSWRRATDGSRNDAKNVFDKNNKGAFSKYIIPLLDNKLNVINRNQEKVLKYIKLNKLSEDVFCDCHICKKYPIEKIKNLYSDDKSNESFHFARILCYVHNVNQHQKICERLHRDLRNGYSVLKLINEITDIKLKNDYEKILSYV